MRIPLHFIQYSTNIIVSYVEFYMHRFLIVMLVTVIGERVICLTYCSVKEDTHYL
jgi:hypothetical protein